MAYRIILTSGGTGGHLFPLATVAEEMSNNSELKDKKIEFLFLGPGGKLEKEIMEEYGIKRKAIACGKLRRYFSFKYILDFLKFPLGVIQSLWYLLRFMPDAVFSKGGYASVPVVFVAWLYRIPILLHESDATPGIANRFMGSLASRVAINFERARMYFPKKKVFLAGVPVRPSVLNGDKQKGRDFLGMKKEVKPTIIFLGGSQGARFINNKVAENIKVLLENFQVIHQTGKRDFKRISKEIAERGYKIEHSDYYPLAFIKKELRHLIALADIAVSRAGATNIAELAANKKPAILVPIHESANDHQRINAYELGREKAAIVLEEKNFSKNMMMHYLKDIMKNEKIKKRLSNNISKFYFPDAAEKISKEILGLMK